VWGSPGQNPPRLGEGGQAPPERPIGRAGCPVPGGGTFSAAHSGKTRDITGVRVGDHRGTVALYVAGITNTKIACCRNTPPIADCPTTQVPLARFPEAGGFWPGDPTPKAMSS